MTNFHGKFVTLHKICARTGCTSAKSELSALGLHRPCHTHFERDADLFVAQFLRRTTTSQEERTSMSCTMELCALSADFTLVHEGCGRPVGDKVWGLRFLYAFELVLSPQSLDERINNKYKIQ